MNVRWKKTWADLTSAPSRSALVVLSIATGVFAVGGVEGTHENLKEALTTVFRRANPAHARLFFLDPLPLDLHESVRRMDGIAEAQTRRALSVRIKAPVVEAETVTLVAILDYKDIRIDKIRSISGAWPPKIDEVLLERSALEKTGLKTGDLITVETPLRKVRTLKVAGAVRDPVSPPARFGANIQGYVAMDTIEALGEIPQPDQLLLRVEKKDATRRDVETLVKGIRKRLEASGHQVMWAWVPPPGQHYATEPVDSLLFILSVLGIAVLVLSGFLLFNTVTSILAQQTRQIGIMKSIGATTAQIAALYVVLVLAYCALAVAIAVPGGAWVARLAAEGTAKLLNLELPAAGLSPRIVAMQCVLGFVIPLLAAGPPILRAARITVREALAFYGLPPATAAGNLLDRIIQRARFVSRPVLLSLRNTFRRRMRLVMTLVTLSAGGAIFLAVLSTRQAMHETLDKAMNYWAYDIEVEFARPYRASRLEAEIMRVPGVKAVETWGFTGAQMMKDWEGREESRVFMMAPPANTTMIRPIIVEGRWLLPTDEAAIVINTEVLRNNPDVKVGDTVLMRVAGHRTTWKVVGKVQSVLGGPWVYANRPYQAVVAREGGRASSVQVVTTGSEPDFIDYVARRIQDHLQAQGLQVTSVGQSAQFRERARSQFDVITSFLIGMALLMAVVGALALAGTMGINVLERVREIGVIRAVGASTSAVLQIFIVEGVTIGLISYLVAVVTSVPVSALLERQVGMMFMRSPLPFTWSVDGALLWLGVVTALSALASLAPAFNASRISVREVLAME